MPSSQGPGPEKPRRTATNGADGGSAARNGGKVTDSRFTPSPQDIGRTLPHSVEAEQGVLGSMLISRDAIAEAVSQITEQYFYSGAHQTIYTALVDLWNAGKD